MIKGAGDRSVHHGFQRWTQGSVSSEYHSTGQSTAVITPIPIAVRVERPSQCMPPCLGVVGDWSRNAGEPNSRSIICTKKQL